MHRFLFNLYLNGERIERNIFIQRTLPRDEDQKYTRTFHCPVCALPQLLLLLRFLSPVDITMFNYTGFLWRIQQEKQSLSGKVIIVLVFVSTLCISVVPWQQHTAHLFSTFSDYKDLCIYFTCTAVQKWFFLSV